jgi:hypothetical protein
LLLAESGNSLHQADENWATLTRCQKLDFAILFKKPACYSPSGRKAVMDWSGTGWAHFGHKFILVKKYPVLRDPENTLRS